MIWTKEWLDSNFEARRKLRFPSLLVQEISCSADVTQFDWAGASFDTQFQNQVLYAGNRYGWNLVLTGFPHATLDWCWVSPRHFFFAFSRETATGQSNIEVSELVQFWLFIPRCLNYTENSALWDDSNGAAIFLHRKRCLKALSPYFLGINTGRFHCCTAWRASESYAMCRECT